MVFLTQQSQIYKPHIPFFENIEQTFPLVIPIPAAREEKGARQIKGHRRPAAWAMCEGGRCGLERTHKGAEGGWHAATVVWEEEGKEKNV